MAAPQPVPIERLLKSAQTYLEAHPNEAAAHYTLARIHYLAFSRGSSEVPALRESGLSGGVYLGVGPDQNFSYIAQLKPTMAIIVDIRRDNLLMHLLLKAIFQLADTRVGYLSLLFGRPPPAYGWQGSITAPLGCSERKADRGVGGRHGCDHGGSRFLGWGECGDGRQ